MASDGLTEEQTVKWKLFVIHSVTSLQKNIAIMYDYQNRESHLKGKLGGRGGGRTWVYGKFDYFTE